MKFILKYTLFLLLLLAAGNMQATIRWVTTADDDGTTPPEGSLRHVLTTQVQDGDTVKFADGLATDTITLATAGFYPFDSGPNMKNKTLTLLGNGVTIFAPSASIPFGATSSNPMSKLKLENIRFAGTMPSMYSVNVHVRNCSFTCDASYTSTSSHTFGINSGISTSASTFEGCAFIMDGKAYNIAGGGTISFVSCTFVKTAATTTPSSTMFFNIGSTASAVNVTMTGCVVMDFSSSNATFRRTDIIRSNGYNVIRKGTGTTGVFTSDPAGGVWQAAAGDTVMPAADPAPLTLDGGIWKVPLASPAYRRLPPQSVLDEVDALADIEFPQKDLSGAGIDYTCKTHSGAWQAVYLADGESEPSSECDGTAATGITLTPPNGTIYTESGTYSITAVVAPGDASQVVTWTSSDPAVATIESDGNSTGRITPLAAGTTTLTATSTATPSVTATVDITVHDYVHVDSIVLPQTLMFYNYMNNNKRIAYRVWPDNANNKKITWSLDDPDGLLDMNTTFLADQNQVSFSFRESAKSLDLYTTTSTATLKATTEDGSHTATCTINIGSGNFTDGVILVCEGNMTTMPGIVNYLHPDGRWEDIIWSGGTTKQFGTVYKDFFISVAKQNADLTFVNAATLNTDMYGCKTALPDGDPRAFVGVDDTVGYLSTSNGIYIFKLDFTATGANTSTAITPSGYITGAEGVASENILAGSGMYTAQSGTMVRAGRYVFALHQTAGLLVIDPAAHQVVQILAGTYNGLVLAADGNLWAGAGGDKLWRIDPWTLDRTEVTMPLPPGAAGPPPTVWGAWRMESLMADPVASGLYWGAGGDDYTRFGPAYFYRYDIDAGTVSSVLDLTAYDGDRWRSYGPTYGLHPATGDMYVAVYTGNGDSNYRMLRVDPASGSVAEEFPMSAQYWFPAAVVFPDNAAPVVDAAFPATVALNAAHLHDTLALRPLVTDADNPAAAIIKTVSAVGDPTLVSAFIRRDTLFVSPLKDLAAPESTTVSLKFNSNGKVATKDVSVTVHPGAIAHPVTGVELNHATAGLSVGATLQLVATVAPSNADNRAVTWKSSVPYMASVDEHGVVTAHLAPGVVDIIVATVEGGFTDTCRITTKAAAVAVTGVALNQAAAELTVGQTLALAATVAPADAANRAVTWKSSVPAIASVSSAGVVASLAPGVADIIVSTVEGGFTDTCRITVKASAVAATGVTLNQSAASLTVGATLALTATVAPANATNKAVTWTSSVPAVASVSSAGVVAALAPGTAVIAATTVDGGHTAFCTVASTSADPVQTNPFELNRHELSLYPGQEATLGLTAPQHFDVAWSSSNVSVATVSAEGVVHSLSAGSTIITARDAAKDKVDMCAVIVAPFPAQTPESVALHTPLLQLTQGETATLQVTLSAGLAGKPVIWSSSHPSVADVTAEGLVISFAPGATLVSAAVDGYTATCAVQVSALRTQSTVENVSTDGARIVIPQVSAEASYYLVHLYSRQGERLLPVYTLKVMPDGSVTTRSAAADGLAVSLAYLASGTPYVAEVETIRETQGRADVIRTEIVAFVTVTVTGTEPAASAAPHVWYAGGTLRASHLAGSVCTVTSANGRSLYRFRAVSSDERHTLRLDPGVYILTARRDGERTAYKFVVVR
jgi:uncharacterized protein YjdB